MADEDSEFEFFMPHPTMLEVDGPAPERRMASGLLDAWGCPIVWVSCPPRNIGFLADLTDEGPDDFFLADGGTT